LRERSNAEAKEAAPWAGFWIGVLTFGTIIGLHYLQKVLEDEAEAG
jgi:hypothetical protein